MKQVSHIPHNGVFSLGMTSAMMEIECTFPPREPRDPVRLVEVLTERFLRDGNRAGTKGSVLLS